MRHEVVSQSEKNGCQHQCRDQVIQDHHESPGLSSLGGFQKSAVWRSFRFHPVDLIGDNLSALHC